MNDKFEYLSEYKSGDPQRGIGFMPKRGVNMHENEVVRAFKTVNDTYIEPISFIVPRRAEVFQDDIYPPTTGIKPAMSSDEWFGGKTALPPKIDMASLYEGEGIKELPADAVPASRKVSAAPAPAPTPVEPKAPAREIKEEPARPVVASPPSMKEQGASMAAMASKFADEEGPEDDADDSSSFEEVSKPVERAPAVAVSPAEPESISSPPSLWKASKQQPPKQNVSIEKVCILSQSTPLYS